MLRIESVMGDCMVTLTTDAPYSPDVADDLITRSVGALITAHQKELADLLIYAPNLLTGDEPDEEKN